MNNVCSLRRVRQVWEHERLFSSCVSAGPTGPDLAEPERSPLPFRIDLRRLGLPVSQHHAPAFTATTRPFRRHITARLPIRLTPIVEVDLQYHPIQFLHVAGRGRPD